MLARPPVFLIHSVMVAVTLVAGAILQAGTSLQDNQSQNGIWVGVFTGAQAERGKAAFEASCAGCHNSDLSGDRGPALVGDRFLVNWETHNLNRLFTKIKDTMPANRPSSLPNDVYLDILTHILQANAFPSGTEELKLTGDTLDNVLIMKKTGSERSREVPNFALVQMVGCLARGLDNTWMLTNVTEPVMTAQDQGFATQELKDLAVKPLGTESFRLLSATPHNPESHQGHKVAATGLVYRLPNDNRLSLTWLEMVASSCVK
jgi:cbb3-type cytochrome c oxidase subunit III